MIFDVYCEYCGCRCTSYELEDGTWNESQIEKHKLAGEACIIYLKESLESLRETVNRLCSNELD